MTVTPVHFIDEFKLSQYMSMDDRLFEGSSIIGWTHLIVSWLFENIQGIEKVGSYRSEKENVDEDILSLGTGA
jgi:hypothetical protein